MTSEAIVERLLHEATMAPDFAEKVFNEAAEEIRRLRDALEPFAGFCTAIDDQEVRLGKRSPDDRVIHPGLTVGHFRAARQALSPTGDT